ncbi:hypothetical protein J3365_19730 [Tritonibacter scottomollicae]
MKIWFKQNMARGPLPPGKRGRQPRYTDVALRACLTVKFSWHAPQLDERVREALFAPGRGRSSVTFHYAEQTL